MTATGLTVYWIHTHTHICQNHDNCFEARNSTILCCNLISKCRNPFTWATQL